ncbi:hypothetical protein COU61_03720 [Candidatus Pacearchaeota archaeon CG10_big_fil_rev_8_21_14_0_10_35_13]|nr:MAG: hypothetical protein COU61_03720 [Candidatus Pacearchaeota archaeon CG10_big_fil_rev_8_21_14_0_10_35_13]
MFGYLSAYHTGRDEARREAFKAIERALYEPVGNGGAIRAGYGHEPSESRKEMLYRIEKIQKQIIQDTNFWNED